MRIVNYSISLFLILVLCSSAITPFVTTNEASAQEIKIPSWVKKSSQWWSEGKISDREYKDAITWLVKKGTIETGGPEISPELCQEYCPVPPNPQNISPEAISFIQNNMQLGTEFSDAFIATLGYDLSSIMLQEEIFLPYIIWGSLSFTDIKKDTPPTEPESGPEPEPEQPQFDATTYINDFNKKTSDCKKFSVTLFVDQPKPKDRTPYFDGDVGHTFVKIEGCGESITLGYYPTKPYGGASFIYEYDDDQPGKIRKDNNHTWDVKKEYSANFAQVEKIKDCMRNWDKNKKYNLVSSNCTDFAKECIAAAGFSVPNGKQTPWPKLPWTVISSNPGDMGEDLMSSGEGGVRNPNP